MSLVENRKQQPADRTDGELVAGIRQSNEKDFTLLYERYYQRVYNFSYLRLRNHADTEEAVQEIFTAVFRSIDAFQGKSSVISWIYGIAKNTVNNSIRRAIAREQRVERGELEMIRNMRSTYAADPEDHLTFQRCEESIRNRLASVSDWQAQIFIMRHFDNLPIDEIASRTSRSNDSVRSSLCRVKRMLVEAIESGGEASLQGGGSMKDRETWASRRRSTSPGDEMSSGVNVDAGVLECSLEELREFLEADLVEVPVDPEFKERLRSRLWNLVQVRNRMRASHARRS